MASLASLLRISSPLIAARSANNSSQCSVPSQKTFFSPRMAGTDLVNNRPAKASMASSIAAASSKISLYKPRWKAHSAERHSVALIAKSDMPANPSLRSHCRAHHKRSYTYRQLAELSPLRAWSHNSNLPKKRGLHHRQQPSLERGR